VVTSQESLPFPGETASAAGLQIRHRRFDSDRSLSAEDPRDVPEIPGFARVFSFSAALAAAVGSDRIRRDRPDSFRHAQPNQWAGRYRVTILVRSAHPDSDRKRVGNS